MNKKQLIVAWVIGVMICFVFLATPYKYVIKRNIGEMVKYTKPKEGYHAGHTVLRWEKIIPRTFTILIIGGLLIYTLRNKKK